MQHCIQLLPGPIPFNLWQIIEFQYAQIDHKWQKSNEAKLAVLSLIDALKDKDIKVRPEAAWALGEIREKRALEPLLDALKDESLSMRTSAANALKKITGKDYDYEKSFN